MEEITIYKSEDGKETPIVEMNPFHLVNALLKSHQLIGENPEMTKALKAEVLRRLNPEPKE